MDKTYRESSEENVASMLCYIGLFVTGILFYLIEKENKTVRFHAMQSILTFLPLTILAWALGHIGAPKLSWAGWYPHFDPGIPALVWASWGIWALTGILWLILMLKAYQGEKFKLPIIGDIAEEKPESPSSKCPSEEDKKQKMVLIKKLEKLRERDAEIYIDDVVCDIDNEYLLQAEKKISERNELLNSYFELKDELRDLEVAFPSVNTGIYDLSRALDRGKRELDWRLFDDVKTRIDEIEQREEKKWAKKEQERLAKEKKRRQKELEEEWKDEQKKLAEGQEKRQKELEEKREAKEKEKRENKKKKDLKRLSELKKQIKLLKDRRNNIYFGYLQGRINEVEFLLTNDSNNPTINLLLYKIKKYTGETNQFLDKVFELERKIGYLEKEYSEINFKIIKEIINNAIIKELRKDKLMHVEELSELLKVFLEDFRRINQKAIDIKKRDKKIDFNIVINFVYDEVKRSPNFDILTKVKLCTDRVERIIDEIIIIKNAIDDILRKEPAFVFKEEISKIYKSVKLLNNQKNILEKDFGLNALSLLSKVSIKIEEGEELINQINKLKIAIDELQKKYEYTTSAFDRSYFPHISKPF